MYYRMVRLMSVLLVVALAGSRALATMVGPNGCGGSIACNVDVHRPGCRGVGSHAAPVPVYIYPPPWPYDPAKTNPYLTHALRWLQHGPAGRSAVAVEDPAAACLFLVTSPCAALCNASRMDCGFFEMWRERPLHALPHWFDGGGGDGGDGGGGADVAALEAGRRGGRNHVLYQAWHTDWELPSYPTGAALLLRSGATRRAFRAGSDVQVRERVLVAAGQLGREGC